MINKLIEKIQSDLNIQVFYHHTKEDDKVGSTFLIILPIDDYSHIADNKVQSISTTYNLILHSIKQDEKCQELETVLNELEIPFDKSRDYDNTLYLYITTYTLWL